MYAAAGKPDNCASEEKIGVLALGTRMSSIDSATCYDCTNNRADGSGPDDRNKLVNLLPPWRYFETSYPVIHAMAKALKPELQVIYARAFGDYPAFGRAVVEMLKYTAKNTASTRLHP